MNIGDEVFVEMSHGNKVEGVITEIHDGVAVVRIGQTKSSTHYLRRKLEDLKLWGKEESTAPPV